MADCNACALVNTSPLALPQDIPETPLAAVIASRVLAHNSNTVIGVVMESACVGVPVSRAILHLDLSMQLYEVVPA